MAQNNGGIALSLSGVDKHFGGLAALSDVNFDVREGEILGLIGPNGAGKTTVINVVTGFLKPDAGSIKFHGEEIGGMPTHRVTLKGLVRSFQLSTFFPSLTVYEHILISCTEALRPNNVSLFLNLSGSRVLQKRAHERTEELMELMGLTEYRNAVPRGLSVGYQRWLQMTMALALEPKLLLLDEPLAGLRLFEMERTLAKLKEIQKERGVSVLMVEHNMRAVMGFCERVVVLNFGHKICEGTPDYVRNNPEVIEAYLGGQHVATA